MFLKIKQWCAHYKVVCWILASLSLLYILAGFIATPMAVHYILKNKVSPALTRQVQAETVRTNPFTFSMRLAKLSVSDRDQGSFVHLGCLYVNVDPLISLFKWAVVVKSVVIENPKVHIVRTAADQFNFSDLIPPSDKKPQDEASSPSKSVRFILNALMLSGGEVHFTDKAQVLPFNTILSAVNIRVDRFDTQPDAASALFLVGARTESDETIQIGGQADVDPLTVSAMVNMEGVVIAKYAPYYSDYLNATVADGTVGLDTQVTWSDDTQSMGDTTMTVSKLTLSASSGESLATVQQFKVADAVIDFKNQEIELGQVSTGPGEIHLQLNAAGKFNLHTAFTPSPSNGEVAAKAPNQPIAEDEAQWVVNLPQFSMKNYTVKYQDQQTHPEANIVLRQIDLNLKHLSTRKGNRATAALTFNWGDKGNLSLAGDLGLSPLAAQMKVDAKSLDIRPLQPYINPHAQLLVTSGYVDTKGELSIISQNNPLDIRYTGVAALNELKTVDKKKARDFLNWKSLYLDGVEFGTAPFRMTINEVALTDFFNRLIINPDGSSNLAAIMDGNKDDATEPEKKEGPPPEVANPATGTRGSDINIKTVTLQGGSVDFSDLLIKPNVRLPMAQIAGRISGLDTLKENKADVLLKGIVGRNVPMEIKGQINPLIERPFIDLVIGLNGVDLSPFTPYSGKYLGYKLEKGQLSLDLAYRVDDNKLTAENKVLLNQLTLGDTVESPTATKLPIKLALALLKDRKGNIDLDLPISGDLDDPEFSFGGIVVKMFVNLIVNIVSSPFSVLGSMFGGGEELAYVDFETGQSLISEQGVGKLETLTKILFERPALRMEIQGQVNPEEDTDGLRHLRFEEQLKSVKLKSMISKGQNAVSAAQIRLAGPEREKIIKKVYADAGLAKPRDEKGKVKKLSPAEMEKLLFTATEISADDLRLLAHRRAQAAKQYLVNQGKIEVDRLFIVEPEIETSDTEGDLQSRVKFNFN
jgi:hypothetical protein